MPDAIDAVSSCCWRAMSDTVEDATVFLTVITASSIEFIRKQSQSSAAHGNVCRLEHSQCLPYGHYALFALQYFPHFFWIAPHAIGVGSSRGFTWSVSVIHTALALAIAPVDSLEVIGQQRKSLVIDGIFPFFE